VVLGDLASHPPQQRLAAECACLPALLSIPMETQWGGPNPSAPWDTSPWNTSPRWNTSDFPKCVPRKPSPMLDFFRFGTPEHMEHQLWVSPVPRIAGNSGGGDQMREGSPWPLVNEANPGWVEGRATGTRAQAPGPGP